MEGKEGEEGAVSSTGQPLWCFAHTYAHKKTHPHDKRVTGRRVWMYAHARTCAHTHTELLLLVTVLELSAGAAATVARFTCDNHVG